MNEKEFINFLSQSAYNFKDVEYAIIMNKDTIKRILVEYCDFTEEEADEYISKLLEVDDV